MTTERDRQLKRLRSRFKRAWLRRYGEASRGSYSRMNLDGLGDDHYSWERLRPSRGYSAYSKYCAERRWRDLAAARVSIPGAMQERRRVLYLKRQTRGGRGHGVTKARAARRRAALQAQADRYVRLANRLRARNAAWARIRRAGSKPPGARRSSLLGRPGASWPHFQTRRGSPSRGQE